MIFVVSFLLFPVADSSYAVDAGLNASFAPGADGKSVSQSTSVDFPEQFQDQNSEPVVGGAQSSSPIRLDRITLRESNTSNDPVICNNAVIDGQLYNSGIRAVAIYVSTTTGKEVDRRNFCFKPNGNELSNPSTPPTYAQMWQELYSKGFLDQAKSSGAFVAPKSPGLTGLPTNIWAQFPDGQVISRRANFKGGYVLNASAYISKVSIFIRKAGGSYTTISNLTSDGSGQINGGSFENPASIYKFRSKGNYEISTGVIWTGRNATLTGPGFGPVSIPLGSIRLEINRDYEVQELKPAITK